MELDEKIIDAHWAKDCNSKAQFFIINEAIISKLCILGEDIEPCFEGANIQAKEFTFSLEEDFKNKIYSLMEEMKNILQGGAPSMENSEMLENIEETLAPTEEISAEPVEEVNPPVEEEVPAEPVEENGETEEEVAEEFAAAPEADPETEPEVEEEPVVGTNYDLNEIVEYQNLLVLYSELETRYNELASSNASVLDELASLRTFKAEIDKKDKENMIKSFYMLSDEDKKDVIENIDTYSVDEIEAKLSIICVRNKVSFNLEEDNIDKPEEPVTYNLEGCEDNLMPAWVKSLQSVAKSLN